MRNPIVGLCMIAVASAGCGGESSPGVSGPSVAAAGSGTTVPPLTASGSGGTKAPVAPPTTPTNTGAAGTKPPSAGSLAPVTAGAASPATAGASGRATGAAGATAGAAGSVTGAAGSGGASAPGGARATEPVIPTMMGECPSFESGSATIMGARVTFLAAKKSEGTGALVFYWHGTGSSPLEGSRFAGTQDITANGGIIVGFSSQSPEGGDCSGTGEHSIGDFNVADQIVACGVANFGIDPKRIYATGCSAGGLQSGCMGINRSAYIAAVVPNSGGVTIGYGPFQDMSRVPNVMTMHGAPGGDVVIVDFSQTSEAYDNYMLQRGAFVINCNHGGGHCGAPAALQASGWQFMKDHPFGTFPSPYASGLPSGFHDSCKIFTMTDRQPLGEGRMMP